MTLRSAEEVLAEELEADGLKADADKLRAGHMHESYHVPVAAIRQAQREAIEACAAIADNLYAGVVAYHISNLLPESDDAKR